MIRRNNNEIPTWLVDRFRNKISRKVERYFMDEDYTFRVLISNDENWADCSRRIGSKVIRRSNQFKNNNTYLNEIEWEEAFSTFRRKITRLNSPLQAWMEAEYRLLEKMNQLTQISDEGDDLEWTILSSEKFRKLKRRKPRVPKEVKNYNWTDCFREIAAKSRRMTIRNKPRTLEEIALSLWITKNRTKLNTKAHKNNWIGLYKRCLAKLELKISFFLY